MVKKEPTSLLKSYITRSCKRIYKKDYLSIRDDILNTFNQMLKELKDKQAKRSTKTTLSR